MTIETIIVRWTGTAEDLEEIARFARDFDWSDRPAIQDPEAAAEQVLESLVREGEIEEPSAEAVEAIREALVESAEAERAERETLLTGMGGLESGPSTRLPTGTMSMPQPYSPTSSEIDSFVESTQLPPVSTVMPSTMPSTESSLQSFPESSSEETVESFPVEPMQASDYGEPIAETRMTGANMAHPGDPHAHAVSAYEARVDSALMRMGYRHEQAHQVIQDYQAKVRASWATAKDPASVARELARLTTASRRFAEGNRAGGGVVRHGWTFEKWLAAAGGIEHFAAVSPDVSGDSVGVARLAARLAWDSGDEPAAYREATSREAFTLENPGGRRWNRARGAVRVDRRAHPRRGYVRADGTHVRPTHVPECTYVLKNGNRAGGSFFEMGWNDWIASRGEFGPAKFAREDPREPSSREYMRGWNGARQAAAAGIAVEKIGGPAYLAAKREMQTRGIIPRNRAGANRAESEPRIYLSTSGGRYRVIDGGSPLSADKSTAEEALAAVAHFQPKIAIADVMWNGDVGEWQPLPSALGDPSVHEWTGPTGVHFRDVRSPSSGVFYHDTTPPEVIDALDRAMGTKKRVRLFYGDRQTGRDWMEENMVTGTVSRSTGKYPIPILLPTSRSMGGGGILTDSIVRMLVDGREVYRHPSYVPREIKIVHENVVSGLPWAAIASAVPGEDQALPGEAHARFKTEAAANRWAAFMRGDRMNKAVGSHGDPEPEAKTYYAAMIDVTPYIGKEALVRGTPFKASQIDKVYEVVVFTLDERVHIASLTPSTYFQIVYYIVKGKRDLPDDEELREKWHEMEDELMRGAEDSYMNHSDAERLVHDEKRPRWMRAKKIGEFESIDDARERAQGNYPF